MPAHNRTEENLLLPAGGVRPGMRIPARPGWPLLVLCLGGLLAAQFLLGCGWGVLLAAAAAVVVGYWALQVGGLENGGAVFCFVFMANSLLWGMASKTLFAQPLDSYLDVPGLTFVLYLLVVCEAVLAYVLVRNVPVGRPVFKPVRRVRVLAFVAYAAYVLSVVFWAANRVLLVDIRYRFLAPRASFGGFAIMQKLFYLALICGTALCLRRSAGKRAFDWFVGLCLVTGIVMGVIDNDKIVIALTIFAYVLTLVYFRGRIRLREAAGALVVVLAFVFVLAPMIQLFRRSGIRRMGLSERVRFVRENWRRISYGDSLLSFFRREGGDPLPRPWDYYGGDVFMLDRMVTVQRSDPVFQAMQTHRSMGVSVLGPGFERLLPGFVHPGKPVVATADVICWELDLRAAYVVAFPVVPLVAHSYVAYKLWGVVLIPFLVFAVFFVLMKKLGWLLKGNVFAVWFFMFPFIGAAEWSFDQFLSFMFRHLPVLAVLVYLLLGAGLFFAGDGSESES